MLQCSMVISSPMKPSNLKYQVINHIPEVDGPEYQILVSEMPELKSYRLVRKGNSWTDTVRDEICLTIEDYGDGFKVKPLDKKLDYAQVAELFILLNFIHHYDSANGGLYCGTIEFADIVKTIEI